MKSKENILIQLTVKNSRFILTALANGYFFVLSFSIQFFYCMEKDQTKKHYVIYLSGIFMFVSVFYFLNVERKHAKIFVNVFLKTTASAKYPDQTKNQL